MESGEEEAGSLSLWLSLVGGTLMFIVALTSPSYSGPTCFSCPKIPPWAVTWVAVLRVLSLSLGAGTMIVASMLRIVGSKWHRSLGGVLIALSVLYMSGLAFSAIVLISSNVVAGLPWAILTASIGPVLVLLGGLMCVKGGRLAR